jgi:hypothetical protein
MEIQGKRRLMGLNNRGVWVLMAAMVTTSLAARAEVDISFTTSGTFGATSTDTYKDLIFTGTAFTGTTVGGALNLSDVGLFDLSRPGGILAVYASTFTEDFLFTIPAGTNHNPTVFDALVTGKVAAIGNDTVTITFGVNSKPVSFSNDAGTGSFVLNIDDITIKLPQSSDTTTTLGTGSITNATFTPVPEPGGIVLLITVIGSVLVFVRNKPRRKLQ